MTPRFLLALLLTASLVGVPASIARASGCPGSPTQSIGPDVVVRDLTGPGNYRIAGTLEALTLGSDACNLGNQEVLWDDCPANTHPVFGSNLYRWRTVNGSKRFEQIGQSWLKHGFAAAQDSNCCANCQPWVDMTRLGVGCDDAYSAFQAAAQGDLGPKYQVNAHTGQYPTGCATHPSGLNVGLLQVEIADLVVTSGGNGAATRYFTQLQYITADDAAAHNQDNNASSREVFTSFSENRWNFFFPAGSVTHAELPAVRLWKTIEAGVVETDIPTPEDDGFPGLVILAAKATDLGNGQWHYEYAINNLNSDRSIGEFSVPCSPYAAVQNIGFHDVAYRGGDGVGGVDYDGTDWPGAHAAGSVTWATTPFATNDNANAVRWGTLYNFRFDADLPPAASSGDVLLVEYKVPVSLTASTVIPSAVTCLKGDLNGDGLVDGGDIAQFAQIFVSGSGTPAQKCAGDTQPTPDGLIDEPDVAPFADCLLNAGCGA